MIATERSFRTAKRIAEITGCTVEKKRDGPARPSLLADDVHDLVVGWIIVAPGRRKAGRNRREEPCNSLGIVLRLEDIKFKRFEWLSGNFEFGYVAISLQTAGGQALFLAFWRLAA